MRMQLISDFKNQHSKNLEVWRFFANYFHSIAYKKTSQSSKLDVKMPILLLHYYSAIEFLQRLRTSSARFNSNSPPRLSRIWTSPALHLWHYFRFWSLFQTDCWVSAEFLRSPIFRKGSGSTPTIVAAAFSDCFLNVVILVLQNWGSQLTGKVINIS